MLKLSFVNCQIKISAGDKNNLGRDAEKTALRA